MIELYTRVDYVRKKALIFQDSWFHRPIVLDVPRSERVYQW